MEDSLSCAQDKLSSAQESFSCEPPASPLDERSAGRAISIFFSRNRIQPGI
jgi:hypothetical protein